MYSVSTDIAVNVGGLTKSNKQLMALKLYSVTITAYCCPKTEMPLDYWPSPHQKWQIEPGAQCLRKFCHMVGIGLPTVRNFSRRSRIRMQCPVVSRTAQFGTSGQCPNFYCAKSNVIKDLISGFRLLSLAVINCCRARNASWTGQNLWLKNPCQISVLTWRILGHFSHVCVYPVTVCGLL